MLRLFRAPPLSPSLIEPLKKWLDSHPKDFTALEVGCGAGLHPIQWAKQNPNGRIIAFERTQEKFARFHSRYLGHPELSNLLPVHGDAQFFLQNLFSNSSVEQIFMLYPNPYPKKSQANLRIANSPFLVALAEVLKQNGKLTIATNLRGYADECALKIPGHTNGLLELTEHRQIDLHATPRTHFEKKYLARGEACWNLIFRRV